MWIEESKSKASSNGIDIDEWQKNQFQAHAKRIIINYLLVVKGIRIVAACSALADYWGIEHRRPAPDDGGAWGCDGDVMAAACLLLLE